MHVIFAILGTLAFFAVPALLCAKRRGILSFFDIALPIAPAVVMLVPLSTVNTEVAWGGIMYPFFCIIFCLLLLYLRVFVLSKLPMAHDILSAGLITSACIVAFLFGIFAPP